VPSGLGGERVSCEEIHSLLFPCINYCDFENPHKYWKYLLTGWAIWCIYVKGVLNKELRTQTVGFWRLNIEMVLLLPELQLKNKTVQD